jgi:hypothetical protein
MATLLTWPVLAMLAAAAPADEKPAAPAPARVTMTGKGASYIQASSVQVEIKAGEDAQKKLSEALKQVTATTFTVGEKGGVVVVLPANTFKLDDALKVIGAVVAVEGVLSSTDNAVLVAVAGGADAKRVPVLVADKVVQLDEKNKDRFPAENGAVVEGTAIKGAITVGGAALEWAIQNGDGRVPLALAKGVGPPEAGAKVRASGKVRVAAGQLVLEATKVEPVKK